jgi:4-hydroxy-tetrahydrodipicolinate reductase
MLFFGIGCFLLMRCRIELKKFVRRKSDTTIKVCLAGAAGWAGSALASGIHGADDMELVGGVSRTHAGKPLGEAIHNPEISLTLSGSAKEALDSKCDVFVEYTKPDVAMQNILLAL